MIAIASTSGQSASSRSRPSTPGPQSSSTRLPSASSMYPEWALPGFGQAGDEPMTVRRTAVFCRCAGPHSSGDRQARSRRSRPGREDHRESAARRGHGGHLHGPPPDAGADRRDRDPGGRGRRRRLDPLGRAHDARPADRVTGSATTGPTTCSSSSAGRSRRTTPTSSSRSESPRSSGRARRRPRSSTSCAAPSQPDMGIARRGNDADSRSR